MDNSKRFKVLELWPESMGNDRINSLLGRLTEIKQETFGGITGLVHSDLDQSIFIMIHESDIAYYLRNNPEEIKNLDLDKFIEGSVNMQGQNYKAYFHRDYLIEESNNLGEYYFYDKSFDQFNIHDKFEINLGKNKDQISGRPKDIDCSFAELDSYFNAAETFVSSIRLDSGNFKSKPKGMMSLEVVFQKEPPEFLLTKLSSFGFSIVELQQVLRQMKDQVIR